LAKTIGAPEVIPEPPIEELKPLVLKKPRKIKEKSEEATAIPTGCVPCALGHYGTCSGILNEAVRFSRGDEGMAADDVLDRVGMCLDELNSMERKDLRPQMINALPPWEKELAQSALEESRSIRHELEAMTTPEELEAVAAGVQTVRQDLYRTWAKRRIKAMSPEEKSEMARSVLEKLEVEDEPAPRRRLVPVASGAPLQSHEDSTEAAPEGESSWEDYDGMEDE